MTKTLAQKTLFRILLAFFVASVFLPSLAFAVSPQPTGTEPWCFSYKTSASSQQLSRCLSTEVSCKSDAGSYDVTSKCGLATNPTVASSVPPSSFGDSTIALAKKAVGWVGDQVAEAAKGLLDATVGNVLEGIAWLIFIMAGFFLQSMAMIMDYSISMTIDSQLIGGLAFVNIGWTLIRDFSNMFFILALLYVAIKTVLGLAGNNTKSWVAHLIIAALLINFSLFLTKVVIDAGNVVAVSFWDKLKVQQGPATINSASTKMLQGLDIQTILKKEENLNSGKKTNPSNTQMAMIYAGGAVFMFIAGYVFLAGALMMVTRTITLILLMVFSPFAFLSFALPGGGFGGAGSKWLETLIKQTFAAPLFIFMLYLNSVLIDSVDLFKLSVSKGDTFSSALSGNASSFAIIYNFILLIGFLIASIHIANKYAGEVGSGARGFAKKFIGTAVAGGGLATAGAAGRQIGGRFGKMTAESEKLRKMAESKNRTSRWFANTAIKTGEVAKKGSFDLRNAPMGGLGLRAALGAGGVNAGTGSSRTYDTHGSALAGVALAGQKMGVNLPNTMTYRGSTKEEEIIKIANERYKLNPVARDQYLRDQLGTHYDAIRHKETRGKVAHDIVAKEKKDTIKTKVEEEKQIKGQLASGAVTKEAAEAALKSVAEAIGSAMSKSNPRDVADMFSLYATSNAFTSNLNKQALHVIHQRNDEGKYDTLKASDGSPLDVTSHITESVMNGPNEATKKYLLSAEGQRKLFNFNVEKYAEAYNAPEKKA